MMDNFTIYKRDEKGQTVFSYTGQIIDRAATSVCIEAYFAFPDRDLDYIFLRRGDLFTEWFYTDRWYNIFRVEDVSTKTLKGFYCNITRPAEITDVSSSADDLALDVFVYPDGRTMLLDEDEFAALEIGESDRKAAWEAVAQLMQMIEKREGPFQSIAG